MTADPDQMRLPSSAVIRVVGIAVLGAVYVTTIAVMLSTAWFGALADHVSLVEFIWVALLLVLLSGWWLVPLGASMMLVLYALESRRIRLTRLQRTLVGMVAGAFGGLVLRHEGFPGQDRNLTIFAVCATIGCVLTAIQPTPSKRHLVIVALIGFAVAALIGVGRR